MVGNYISLTSLEQSKTGKAGTYSSNTRTVLSPDLNLAIISGDFCDLESVTQLERLLESVKAHLITSDQLTIHLALQKVDQDAIGQLVDLVRILNIGSLIDKVICLHWVTSDNPVVNRIGEEFQMTCAFEWKNQ